MEKFEIGKSKIEKRDEKLEAKEKLKKKLRTMTVWGMVVLSSLGALKLLDRGYQKYEKGKFSPKAVMAYVEKQKPLTEIEKIELKKKIDYLREQFSNRIIDLLQKSTEVNKEIDRSPIKIKGFEKVGLSTEELKKLWSEKYYPKGWLDKEIAEVEYKEEEAEGVILGYGLNEETKLAGINELGKKGKSKIIFFGSFKFETKAEFKDFLESLDWYFSHEASHSNDWANKATLDFKQRAEFLYDIAQNCFREGAFRDILGYIDSIKNPDPYKERYYKVREYWALICEYYFTFPEFLKENYPQEFELVDKYVKKEDPTFDTFKKKEERGKLIKQIYDQEKERSKKQDSV